MKKIKRIFNFILESLAIILFSLLIVVLLQKIIITLLNNFNFNISIDCGNLLSGIIGSILSCFFVMVGFIINKNSKKIDNQLVLRNMFSEKLRWEVHRTIETGDVSYWYKQSKEDIPKEFLENNEIISGIFENKTWLESRAYKYHFEPALFDYMGVFEIAYKMIKKHELSWSNFKMSYLYRIESLLKNPIVNKELFGNDEAYWKCFFSLVKKLK